jgi:hypothetical protein
MNLNNSSIKKRVYVVSAILTVACVASFSWSRELVNSNRETKERINEKHFDSNGLAGPFSGELLGLIIRAIPKLKEEGLDFEKYDVYVCMYEDAYGVGFSDPAKDPLLVGGGSKELDLPSFVVYFEKSTLAITSASYSK